MIGPEQRVSKPAGKSHRNVAAAMGKRRRRTDGPQQQHYRDGRNFIVPASLRPDWPQCASSPVHRYVCLEGLERNSELLCKIAIRIHGGCSVKITQQIDLIVARQLEHGLVKRDHQRAIGLKI